MNAAVKRLIKIAEGELGYLAKASNSQLDDKTANAGNGKYTKYARDLFSAGYYNGNKNGYDWCDVFVDWLFYTLCKQDASKAQHIICQTGPLGAGCLYSMGYYKNADRFYTTPEAGDQIFYNWGHTGIVYKVDNNRVYTIEGNTTISGSSYYGVYAKERELGSSVILGYGRPRYEELNIIEVTFNPHIKMINATSAYLDIVTENKDELADLKLAYTVTDLNNNKISTSAVISTASNKISGLLPNTPYLIQLKAEDSEASISKQVIFTTLKEFPNPVKALKIEFNDADLLSSEKCKLTFKEPDFWGTSIANQGYRLNILVNGKIVSKNDSVISSTNTTLFLKELFHDINLTRGDVLQFGIQSWVKNHNDEIVFSKYSVCTTPIYLKSKLTTADKIHININNTHKRCILHLT